MMNKRIYKRIFEDVDINRNINSLKVEPCEAPTPTILV